MTDTITDKMIAAGVRELADAKEASAEDRATAIYQAMATEQRTPSKEPMIDLYLRADTETALAKALPLLRGKDEDGKMAWLTSGPSWALDVIGSIETTPGTYDEEGKVIVAPVVDGRFHANLRCSSEIAAQVPEAMKLPQPATPRRMWA